MPKEKNLTKKDIGFAKRKKFSQKNIQVLPIEKSLVKNTYKFCQKNFLKPRIDIGFAHKTV